jgi:alpha-tubulin suppressor-like RCC1 family protein
MVTKIYFKQNDYFTTNYGYRCEPCDVSVCGDVKVVDDVGDTYIPTLIQTFVDDDISITEISTMGTYCLFLTSDNRVYSCGFNNHGQLGLGENSKGERKVWTPRLIETFKDTDTVIHNYDEIRITEISCGYYHSLFLTSTNRVYSCGYNYDGQLGLGDGVGGKLFTPTLIQTFVDDGIQIDKISAGGFFSLFLTQTWSVYSCGANSVGQLGLNSAEKNKTTPELIINSNNVRITDISSGISNSIFLLNYGNFDIEEEGDGEEEGEGGGEG